MTRPATDHPAILGTDLSVAPAGAGVAGNYARRLLTDLGLRPGAAGAGADEHPARREAGSGVMALSGTAGTPELCPVPLAACADGALDALRALAGGAILPGTRGAGLLVERAAIAGTGPRGSQSHGGFCRLLPSRDGMLGVNLPRPEDWQLLPAWLQAGDCGDWAGLARQVAVRGSADLLRRGRELGLAVADATQIPEQVPPWYRASRHAPAAPHRGAVPRVLDLTALWAGPLCSHLWLAAGAQVTKVESTRRPDGARAGAPEFFATLNRGKRCVGLDLHVEAGRRELRALIAAADIVLEASRPRALRQMGVVAEAMLAERPGLTWVSITGYGRGEPEENWIAYGDDAGIAAGLSAVLHAATGRWLICGDAIADPLAGLHAALAGWAGWLAGGGLLLDLALERTVHHCITATAPQDGDYGARYGRWRAHLDEHDVAAQPPARRAGPGPSAC